MLRWLTAGESHGPALVAILEGLPAGVAVTTADVARDLARRRLGVGRGARMKFEQDEVEFLGGVRHGLTMGGPVAIRVGNTEWPKWETVDGGRPGRPRGARRAGPQRPADPAAARPRGPGRACRSTASTTPGPVLERASARETAARVALGAVARRSCAQAVGRRGPQPRRAHSAPRPRRPALVADRRRPGPPSTPTRSAAWTRRRARPCRPRSRPAHKDGDTLGGVVEVVVARASAGPGQPRALGPAPGRPAGRGAHGHPGDQGRRGRRRVRPGPRRAGRRRRTRSCTTPTALRRTSGRSGGTEGGMSTGEVLRVRAAMKPISTVPRALRTVDVRHRRAGQGDQPALRRVRGARRRRGRRGDGRPGRWPTRCWRSSAGTRVAETRRNRGLATSTTLVVR